MSLFEVAGSGQVRFTGRIRPSPESEFAATGGVEVGIVGGEKYAL
jgi:hypothetical protein